jgi:hypothetical protein
LLSKLDSESLSPEAVKNLLHVAGTLPCQFSVPIVLLPDTLRAAHQLQFTALIGPLANALCENLDFETALPTWTLFEHLSLKRPQLEEYVEGMRFVLRASLRISDRSCAAHRKLWRNFANPRVSGPRFLPHQRTYAEGRYFNRRGGLIQTIGALDTPPI